jgi:uncharacterized protein DUF3592
MPPNILRLHFHWYRRACADPGRYLVCTPESFSCQSATRVWNCHGDPDDDGDAIYAPVVEFRTENGGPATYKSSLYSRPCKYKVGDKVDVLYNPDKPADAQIKGRKMNSLPMLVLGGLGMIFTTVGVVLALVLPHR